MQFLLSIALQSVIVLFVFPWIDDRFRVNGGFKNAIIVVLIFLVLNVLIRWLFVIFTFGLGWVLYYVSLGLLGLVANAVVLLLISHFAPQFLSVPSFASAFWGGVALALAAFIMQK